MNKITKDLFLKLKALRPHIHGITHIYGTNWKNDEIEDIWFLDMPQPIKFSNEKDLQDKLKELIKSTESDLGFRFPHTSKKLNL
jgi:hypothetical protein